MSFLNPWAALAAAAVAIPLLLLLYFLKLRRRLLRVPSTLLWQRSAEDMQVNAPFKRLRPSVLLALQIGSLLLLLLALAQPRLSAATAPAARMVLLIDRSASMAAASGAGIRLDRAKAVAAEVIGQLRRGSEASEVMVIAFAASATVVSGFESDAELVLERLAALQAAAEPSDLAAALRLADGFAARADEGDEPAADVILLSDGVMAEPGDGRGFLLRAGRFRFVQVVPEGSPPPRNLGIVTLSARRDYENPTEVRCFARLLNAGPDPVETVLTLRAAGQVVALRSVTVPPAGPRGPGEASVTLAFEHPQGAAFHLAHSTSDDLPLDDEAWLVLPAPAPPRIALVQPPQGADPFLREVLDALEPARLDPMTLERFGGLAEERLDSGELYDLVIFDRVDPPRLPGVASIGFGALPAGFERGGAAVPTAGRRILSWQRGHPLLRHVSLDELAYSGEAAYRAPAGATVLAYGPDGPIMLLVSSRGARHVLVGFALERSNWPVQLGFAVFVANAIDALTLAGPAQEGVFVRPGEPIQVRAASDADRVRARGPDGPDVPAVRGGLVTLPPFQRAGLFELEGVVERWRQVAVSLLSDAESDLRPRGAVTVNAGPVQAGAAADVVPLELWPWLVAAAGLLLALEWVTYCLRMSR
jgi:hypothetical protein